jgi:Holliday junction resolvase RusA-like endonuclease
MLSAIFIVRGKIKPKERPRVFKRRNGKFGIFTPKSTQASEANIAKEYLTQCKTHFGERYVELDIRTYQQIPKSYTKKDRVLISLGELYPKRFDIDNLCKSVMDGLNNVAYIDDSQVVKVTCRKDYANETYTQITIREFHETN